MRGPGEVRCQMLEARSQKCGPGQTAEGRSQKAEGRSQEFPRGQRILTTKTQSHKGSDQGRRQTDEGRRQMADTGTRSLTTKTPRHKGQVSRRGHRTGSWLAVLLVMSASVLPSCAKKMIPPSPDRWAPRLQEVETRTRSQVTLVFDEEMDGAKLRPDSFLLTGPAGETIALRGASLGHGNGEVQLWTPIQEVKLYEVRGVVWDRAGNKTHFRARFRGSSKQDTIAPRVASIEPAPGDVRQKRGVRIRVTFSEAIDTSGVVNSMFVPAGYDTLFNRAWSTDWQTLSFTRLDSMPSGAFVYLLVQPGAADLEGNRDKAPAFTYFTSDTIFDAVPVRGKAGWPSELGTGVVFFTESASVRVITDSLKPPRTESLPVRTTGLAPVLSNGSFATKLRKGEYEVVAVADTNGDGKAELVSPAVKFNTDAESLNLSLVPESLPQPLNAYRR